MAVRTVAEKAGVASSTAQRALKKLETANMVEVVGEATRAHGTRYQLIHPSGWASDTRGTVCPSTCVGGVGLQTVPPASVSETEQLAQDVSNDIWAAQGLGESGRQTYRALAGAPDSTSAAEIGGHLDRSDRTVQRNLKALADVGLARPLGRGRWTVEYRDPTAVAFDLGVVTVSADRRSQHERERRQDAVRGVKRRLNARGVAPFKPPATLAAEPISTPPERNRSQDPSDPVARTQQAAACVPQGSSKIRIPAVHRPQATSTSIGAAS